MKYNTIKDFLLWMSNKKICSVIPFLVSMEGRDSKIPHWTNGKQLFSADELVSMFDKERTKQNEKTKTRRQA